MMEEVQGRMSCLRRGSLNYYWSGVFNLGRLLLLFQVVSGALGDRTFTKVYEPILGTQACFKRLNGTHEIGCRSPNAGQVGVLHVIEDKESLQWVLKDGPHAPYIAIVYPEDFNRENLLQFRDSGRINGVLLLKEKKDESDSLFPVNKNISMFSTDSSCPNEQFSFYKNSNGTTSKSCPEWNKPGNNLLFENFDFPIFHVTDDTEAKTVLNCYNTFNRPVNGTAQEWPLCAGQLKSFMMAAKDTPTCLRRSSAFSINPGTTKVCDPLGDQNLWATLYPQNRTENESQSAIILATHFDGASFFDEMSPSTDSSVTGLVTLLTVIKQLSAIKDKLVLSPDSPVNNIYFMVFNGESFGYIGSSRIVYDMLGGRFPLKLDEIQYYLEINQAASVAPDSYYVHQSDESQSKEFTDILESQAKAQNLSLKTIQNSPWGVPPSSLHSFLRERPNITGLVLTNHGRSYRNQFYNSIFDTKEKIKYNYTDRSIFSIQQRLASLSATVANSLVKLLQLEEPIEPITPDLETVDELLHCYLETNNCTIFRDISGFKPGKDTPVPPYPLYVGVATYTNSLTQLTKYLVVSYLGTNISSVDNTTITKEEDCWKMDTPGPHYFFNDTCYDCSLVNLTEAKSPAFLIPDYDWSSGKYSTWSESVWQKFSVRIFLKPSLAHEVLTLVSGILVVIVSMLFMRFVNEKKDVIFPSRDYWQIRYPWWTFAGTVVNGVILMIQLGAAQSFFRAVPLVFISIIINLFIFKL